VEVRVGFEPTVLGICSPLPWATRPPHCNLTSGTLEAGVIQSSIRSRQRHEYWSNPVLVGVRFFLNQQKQSNLCAHV
jgi:hypothetical protein